MVMKLFGFLKKNDLDKYKKRQAKLYKEIFNTPSGQEVLADLVATGYILESTEGDILKEGCRKAILRILGILEYDTRSFKNLTAQMKETNEVEKED